MFKIFLIFLFIPGYFASDNIDYINIILSLKNSLNSDCLIFITPEYDLSSIQWIKIILKNTSGIYLLDSSLNRSFNFCSRSFYVVFPLQSFYIEEIIIPRILSIRSDHMLSVLIPGSRTSINPYLKKYYIPINWLFLVAEHTKKHDNSWCIHEVYKQSPNSLLKWNIYANAKNNQIIISNDFSIDERRKDLGDIILRTVINGVNPLSTIDFRPEGNPIHFGGFFGYVLDLLKEEMHFKTHYIFDSKSNFGILLPNGSWTGVFGLIQRKEGDLLAAATSMTSSRATAVKHFPVLSRLSQDIFIREPSEENINWTGFFRPFETPLWMTFLGMSIVLGLIIKLPFYLVGQNSSSQESLFMSFSAIFFQQASTFLATTTSSKVLLFTTYALGLLGFAAYSAKLIVFLTYKTLQMPFDSPEGLLADGTYLVGTSAGTATFSNLQKSKGGILKALYEAGIAKDMKNAAPTFNAAFERACTNRYAAVAYRILLDPSLVTCNLARLKIPLLVNPWTMGLPTHSEYSGIFTKRILKLHENGVIRLIMEKTIPIVISPERGGARAAYAASLVTGFKSPFDPITLTNIISIFIIYLIGLFLSLLVFISELIYNRVKSTEITLKI